ncbi:hypothetical protein [Luteitalea sp.]
MSTRRRLIVLVPSPEGAASAAATTVAVGAVACGVCCVLPFALPAVVLASSGGALAMFAQAFWGALYLAAAMVGTAWLWILAETRRSGKRPARTTLGMMAVGTAALAAAALWPSLEPHLIAAIKELFE